MVMLRKGKEVAKEDRDGTIGHSNGIHNKAIEESIGHSVDAVYSNGKIGPIHSTIGTMIAQQTAVIVYLETMMTE